MTCFFPEAYASSCIWDHARTDFWVATLHFKARCIPSSRKKGRKDLKQCCFAILGGKGFWAAGLELGHLKNENHAVWHRKGWELSACKSWAAKSASQPTRNNKLLQCSVARELTSRHFVFRIYAMAKGPWNDEVDTESVCNSESWLKDANRSCCTLMPSMDSPENAMRSYRASSV